MALGSQIRGVENELSAPDWIPHLQFRSATDTRNTRHAKSKAKTIEQEKKVTIFKLLTFDLRLCSS